LSKVQYWQLIDIPGLISSYCFYKDICPSPNYTPNLLQLPILHLYGKLRTDFYMVSTFIGLKSDH